MAFLLFSLSMYLIGFNSFDNNIDPNLKFEFLGYINWIIPVDNIIAIGELWLVSVGIYYIYSIAMRWVKMIE